MDGLLMVAAFLGAVTVLASTVMLSVVGLTGSLRYLIRRLLVIDAIGMALVVLALVSMLSSLGSCSGNIAC